MRKVFLLSPARVGGARANLLLNPEATFPLALRFRREGLSLADVFAFTSGLYFRGKILYARRFTESDAPRSAIRVITANAGLLDPEQVVTPEQLRAFGTVDITADDPRYYEPLRRDADALAAMLEPDGLAVLLGSIATAKYRDVLLASFTQRLVFPADFVGRGDLSRGGLMLRAARIGVELRYVSALGAVFRGRRPPRNREL